MKKKFLRHIFYIFYDLLNFFISFRPDKDFIIIYPRIINIFYKKIYIYDKKNKKIFFQIVRNFSDVLTVYEIFGEENYSFKNLKNNSFRNSYKKIISSNKTPLIIDCGSNIGSSTEYFHRLLPGSYFLIIEPDKNSLDFSHKNITTNKLTKFNNAISSDNKVYNFDRNNNDYRASKITEKGIDKINSITINELLREYSTFKPFMIKIDIEGFEKNLFEQNYDWIDKFDILIIELHDWMLPEVSNSFNFLSAITDIMKKYSKRDLIISGENLISIKNNEK
tara:strand:- start:8826 stop:9662 length:837 start_codon:yes stop_codon:yes gene_type:complete